MKQTRKSSLILCALAIFCAMSAFTLKPKAANETVTRTTLTRDFRSAMELIRAKYVEQVEYQALTKAGIEGMLQVLDPHSDYFDRKAFAEMNSEQRSHYFGIGAQIAPRYRGTYILETFEGTPAARAGLRYGDHIIAIDGTDTSTWTSDRVRNLLRGERGTIVRVTVQRPGAADPITFPIQRDSVALPSITNYYLARPDIGYINLSRGFHSTTSDELNSIMAELSEKGARSFILDLRGNRGGYLDQAIKVADRFLQRGQVIVSVRGRDSKNFDRDIAAEIGAKENIPLVVLINRESASASEIVAGAIQDHDRGLIVGESSFGKGLVQNIFPLSDGSGLTLTIARYYTPSGRLIQRDYSNGLAEELDLRRRFIAGYHVLRDRDPQRLTRLESEIRRFVSELGSVGIEPHELRPRIDVGLVARLLLLFPLAAAGTVTHYIPYRIVDLLGRRFSRGASELTATVKFVSALAIYPISWLVIAAVVWRFWGVALALAMLFALPILGYAALRLMEELDDAIGRTRALSHRLFSRDTHQHLIEQRRAIRREIASLETLVGP